MIVDPNSPWLFVIDTADYAGNFERDLCAFITGKVGDCGQGDEMVELFMRQVEKSDEYLFDNVITEADDHGCWRPVTIYQTCPGKNNSVAIFFENRPSSQQIETMKERTLMFAKMPNKWMPSTPFISEITGFRLIKNKVVRTTEEENV